MAAEKRRRLLLPRRSPGAAHHCRDGCSHRTLRPSTPTLVRLCRTERVGSPLSMTSASPQAPDRASCVSRSAKALSSHSRASAAAVSQVGVQSGIDGSGAEGSIVAIRR